MALNVLTRLIRALFGFFLLFFCFVFVLVGDVGGGVNGGEVDEDDEGWTGLFRIPPKILAISSSVLIFYVFLIWFDLVLN